MTTEELMAFCRRWLDAWTGNRPDELLKFYADDAFYRDPGQPEGLRGSAALGSYFKKLLAANPTWRWAPVEIIPTPRGCTLKWQATIPVGERTIEETGVDIVEIAGDQITRNEVYFDRTALVGALSKLRARS